MLTQGDIYGRGRSGNEEGGVVDGTGDSGPDHDCGTKRSIEVLRNPQRKRQTPTLPLCTTVVELDLGILSKVMKEFSL